MPYVVYVDDNAHYQDDAERYRLGEFERYDDAVRAAQGIERYRPPRWVDFRPRTCAPAVQVACPSIPSSPCTKVTTSLRGPKPAPPRSARQSGRSHRPRAAVARICRRRLEKRTVRNRPETPADR